MKNFENDTFTESDDDFFGIAADEQPVTEENLLTEIAAVMDDYFLLEFNAERTKLGIKLYNGQEFELSVKETV